MTSAIDPLSSKQLFLDNHSIHSIVGVSRTLHQPEKQGPLITSDGSSGQVNVNSRNSPQWNADRGLWEWWYWSTCPEVATGKHTLPHYATSADGLNWDKPSLGLYEWRGSRHNNISSYPDGRRLYHVIRDENEENPERLYKGLFDFRDRWIGFSPGGFTWDMPDRSPIPSGDESHLIYDPYTKLYAAFVKQSTEWGRSVYLSTSPDFEEWTFPELVFKTDEIDMYNREQRIKKIVDDPAYLTPHVVEQHDFIAHCYQMAVLPYEGIYIGFPAIFNPSGRWLGANHTGISQIELTVSRDMYNWNRVADRDLFIEVDPWDGINYGTAQNLLCGKPIVRDSEIWIYYGAYRLRCRPEDIDQTVYALAEGELAKDLGALSLAKLRLDGFVSMDAQSEGIILTEPFRLVDDRLYVNVDATNGEVICELLDYETKKPLTGLSAAENIPITGDHITKLVSWRNNDNPVNDRMVQAKFLMKHASLYSFWLGLRE